MIAGIVAFVAVATSVALGNPCGFSGLNGGLYSNGLIGSRLVGSGLVGSGIVGSGIVGSGIVESGIVGSRAAGCGIFGSEIVGSEAAGASGVVATPSAVYPSFTAPICSSSAPATQTFNDIVGSGSEVVPTEAVAPEYSTIVSPSSSSSFGVSGVSDSCEGSFSSGVSTLGSSVVVPSVAPVLSSGISSGSCGSQVLSSGISSYGYPSVQSGLYNGPAYAVVDAGSSPVFGSSQVLSSGCGSSVFGSTGVVSRPATSTIVSVPVVESNVATPISGGLISSGVSSGSILNGC